MKVGSKGRSDVRCQPQRQGSSFALRAALRMIAHRWGRGLKDVGDQALMRGLDTAVPSVRPGRSLSYGGRRAVPATKRLTGVPLPWPRPRLCASYSLVAIAGDRGFS